MKIIYAIALLSAVARGIFLLGSVRENVRQTKSSITIAPHDTGSFNVMMKVITSVRCMNCHPSDDRPRQGDDQHLHRFEVQRGIDNKGMVAMRCNTCHGSENNQISNVPGAPHWQLAPRSMGWLGLSKEQIAASLLDKRKNGNREVKDIVNHLLKDSLVRWAWAPGVGRTPPPVTFEVFADAVNHWAAREEELLKIKKSR